MAKAVFNNVTVAESDKTVVIEGNHYFPPETIKKEFFRASDTRTTCHWKGEAHYYTVEVNGESSEDAAWFYPVVSDMASGIKGYVAFWKGVAVEA